MSDRSRLISTVYQAVMPRSRIFSEVAGGMLLSAEEVEKIPIYSNHKIVKRIMQITMASPAWFTFLI